MFRVECCIVFACQLVRVGVTVAHIVLSICSSSAPPPLVLHALCCVVLYSAGV